MVAREVIRTAPRRPRVVAAALATTLLVLLAALPLAAKKPLKEIWIDCADGASINQALTKQETRLIIHIRGICTEDVVVRRDNVVLRGADPALDGIRAATVDASYGAALLLRGVRQVEIENLQVIGGKHAGLMIEDSRRGVTLRNLRIEGNREVGLRAANSLVVGYDLDVSGNGLAGIGLSETAYLRCIDCRVADNPSTDFGFGIVGSAGALATLFGGSISGYWPISFRFNSVAELNDAEVSGYVALDARDNASIVAKGSTIDGSIRAYSDSRIKLESSRQSFNPATGGNRITGGSQLTGSGTSTLLGATALDEFSNGVFSGTSSLETLSCATGADVSCSAGVQVTSSSCASC